MRIDSPLMTNAVITGSFSGSFTGTGNFVGLEADSVEFANVLNKPTLVSGSSQIDITSTTGFTSFSSSIAGEIAGLDGEYATDAELNASSSALTTAYRSELNTSSSALTSAYQSADTGLSSSLAVDIALNDGRLDTLEGKTLFSGSSQVDLASVTNATTTNVSEGTNLYYTDTRVKTKLNAESVVSGSSQISFNGITDKPTLVSGSDQLSGSLVDLVSDQSIGGTKTFSNIVVNGTGSFAFIQSTTGSSTSIGEAFIVLNENTPSSNFAGIKVVDSGSTFTTSSFLYDGQNNQWLFQHEGSENSGSSLAIFGPLTQGGLGTEVGLTENKIPKAVTDHGHHIGDSNITDTGTLITLGSNTTVSGNLSATKFIGVVSSSAQIDVASTTGDIALGTRTSGNYVASMTAGTGITVGTATGEGSTPVLTNTGVTSNVAGTGITVSGATGAVTITNSSPNATHTGDVTGATALTIANDVVGAAQLKVTGNGTESQFLRSDGDGTFTWATVTGYSVSNSADNRILTSVDASNGNAEANLTFDGSTLSVSGTVSATCIIETSALRCKSNIEPLHFSLEKVKQLKPVSFDWKNSGKSDIGFIAEEVKEVLPNLIHYNIDGEVEGMNYSKITSLLVSSIHELEFKINKLSNEIEKLKNN